jgi:thiol:disulfide interchange protein DsbD
MKKLLPVYAILFITNVFSQKDPIQWKAAFFYQLDGKGYIEITGTLEKGWHTYSTRITGDGPIPTSFSFQPASFYKLDGNVQEIGAHEEYVAAFDMKLSLFSEKAVFRQGILVTGSRGGKVKISVEYMCCNDNMCLPPKTIDLWVDIK